MYKLAIPNLKSRNYYRTYFQSTNVYIDVYIIHFIPILALYGSLLAVPLMEKRLAKIIASVSSAYCLLVIIIEVIVNLEEYQSSLDIEFPDIFTIDEFESMRKKKIKLRTICNVYEKQFYIFKRNIGKEWRIFDIAYWINELSLIHI